MSKWYAKPELPVVPKETMLVLVRKYVRNVDLESIISSMHLNALARTLLETQADSLQWSRTDYNLEAMLVKNDASYCLAYSHLHTDKAIVAPCNYLIFQGNNTILKTTIIVDESLSHPTEFIKSVL